MSPIRARQLVPVLMAATMAAAVWAATKPAINTSRGQLALRGYDPVAYFTDGKPTLGTASFEFRWRDAVWRFATAAHRARFIEEPGRYAPQFGGYCAYAVSRGYTADGDPTVWRIVEGRLYVNYSARAQKLWEEDVPGNIARGHQNWPGVLAK